MRVFRKRNFDSQIFRRAFKREIVSFVFEQSSKFELFILAVFVYQIMPFRVVAGKQAEVKFGRVKNFEHLLLRIFSLAFYFYVVGNRAVGMESVNLCQRDFEDIFAIINVSDIAQLPRIIRDFFRCVIRVHKIAYVANFVFLLSFRGVQSIVKMIEPEKTQVPVVNERILLRLRKLRSLLLQEIYLSPLFIKDSKII